MQPPNLRTVNSDVEQVNPAGLRDEALARLAQQGCIEAGNVLFERHLRQLRDFARFVYFGAPDRTSEDLLQEAYRVAWARFGEFGPPYRFLPWVRSIIKRTAQNWVRSDRMRLQNLGTLSPTTDIEQVEGDCPPGAPDLGGLFTELRQALLAFGQAHPKKWQKEVGLFMLGYFAENQVLPPLAVIVQATGAPRMSAYRCRERIRKHWDKVAKQHGIWPLQ
jgi:RNA polymerase sigma factor (sigma-70 family)